MAKIKKKRPKNPSLVLRKQVLPLLKKAQKGDKQAAHTLDRWMQDSEEVRRMVETLLHPVRDRFVSSSLIRRGKKPNVYSRSVQGGAPQ